MNAKRAVGDYIRKHVIPPGMSVKEAAARLGVGRPALSNLLNGKAALSADMTVRLEKSFGANREQLVDLQAKADRTKQRDAERSLAVRRYVPNFLSIKARDIELWAETHLEARNLLAVLLRRLVHSTGNSLRRVEFPGHDNAEKKGPDGIVESDAATAWIPEGKSYWEFGVNEDVRRKVEKDYMARLSLPATERANSVYVAVTPRNWSGKHAWIKERKAHGDWKDIRALDADDLEQWIEESIPAQIWLAEKLGIPTVGFETLDSCWERWAAGSEPRMTPEIFAPSIAAHAGTFREWLAREDKKPLVIAADSADEGLAFLACMSEQLAIDSGFRDLAAVFDSPETLRKLAPSSSPFIPIVTTDAAERELIKVYREHPSIVVRPRNAVDSEPAIALDLLRHEDFEKALVAMKMPSDAIERLRKESGMSPTILRRRLSQVDAIRSPIWARNLETARELIPMMWVGAWNEKSKADIEILSELASRPYQEIEKCIVRLLLLDDSPVWSTANYRGVSSKIDLLFAVARVVTRKDLDDFLSLADYVLSEADPALELPEDNRWAAAIYGKKREHSSALREGICESLVILAVHGNSLFQERLGIDVEGTIGRLVEQLLTPLTLDKLMSHQHDLPRYAEAAPEAFLGLLEADLSTPDPVVVGLLRPASTGIFGGCPRSGLLWALECLAWKPQNLPRVASILAQLARVRINDNWGNKPIRSLEGIFRSWMPQTAASLQERCMTLDFIVNRYPDVGWKICLEQFKAGSRIGTYSYRPQWRSDASGAGQPVKTQRESAEFCRKSLELALGWPSHNQDTLSDLVGQLEGMEERDRARLWALIDKWAIDPSTAEMEKSTLRERIRRLVLTSLGRRRFADGETRSRAQAACANLESSDLVIRHGWLFENQWVEATALETDNDRDFEARDERVHALRAAAIQEIWDQKGLDGVLSLLEQSGAPAVVGKHLASYLAQTSDRLQFIRRCTTLVGDLELKSNECIHGFLWAVDSADRSSLLRCVAERLGPLERARLFKAAPFEKATWLLVEEYGAEGLERYWKEVHPYWSRRQPDSDLDELVYRLLEVRRPRAAFHAAHMDWSRLSSALLKRLLVEVSTERNEAQGAYLLEEHDIEAAIQALDGRSGVTQDDMAEIEFRFASALEHSKRGIPNLERQICESPRLFVQIVSQIWKRSDEGQDPPGWEIEDLELRSSVGRAMYSVLDQLKTIPGTDAEGKIVPTALLGWLTEARSAAREYGRADITDQRIGQLLARAPSGSEGTWPCTEVCEAMERIGSPELARGFQIGVHNSRGAVVRGEGGTQERDLAGKYRGWARTLAFEFPHVASVLEAIASSYDRQGEWHDSEAKVSHRLRR